jgi:excisionase family DNA binding protein
MTTATAPQRLLRPGQVAAMFGVHPRTLTRWANQGLISPVRTLRGHRRYKESEVRALIDSGRQERRDAS